MLTAKNQESGFTLVEVMIAMMIMMIALMGAASMQTKAVESSNFANRMTGRVTSAEMVMEDLLNRPIVPSDPALDPIFNAPDGQLQDSLLVGTGKAYSVQYQVIPDSPFNELTTINVTATPLNVQNAENKKLTYSIVRSTRYNR